MKSEPQDHKGKKLTKKEQAITKLAGQVLDYRIKWQSAKREKTEAEGRERIAIDIAGKSRAVVDTFRKEATEAGMEEAVKLLDDVRVRVYQVK